MKRLLAIVLLLITSTLQAADLFDWSPAASHHSAAVVVRAGSSGGSGVYVRLSDSAVGVLTCQHVVTGNAQASVTFSDGTQSSGDVWTDKNQTDTAVIVVQQHATIQPLKIADAPPAQGERVEYLGYGGPQQATLRHHWGTVLGYQGADIRTTAPVISGDSGGCILNERAEVVGLSGYGLDTIATAGEWQVYRPSGGPSQPVLAAFASRVLTRIGGQAEQTGYG